MPQDRWNKLAAMASQFTSCNHECKCLCHAGKKIHEGGIPACDCLSCGRGHHGIAAGQLQNHIRECHKK